MYDRLFSILIIPVWILLAATNLIAQPTTIKDVSPTATTFPIASSVNHSASGKVFNVAGSADGTRLYAGSQAGIWRSDDAGENWYQMTRPQPPTGQNVVPGALPASFINDIVVSPVDPDHVYVLAYETARTISTSGAYQSRDGGQTWSLIQLIGNGLGQIVIAPDDPNLVFIAAGSVIHTSRDAGVSWTTTNMPLAVWHIAIAELLGANRRVYALGRGVVFVSFNGGGTWHRDLSAQIPTMIGGPVDDHGGNSAQIMVVIPGTTNQIMVSSPSWANGPSYWRNNNLLDGDGAICNTHIIYDVNDNNGYDDSDIIIYGLKLSSLPSLIDIPKLKYIDADSNNRWNANERIIFDADDNSLYQSSTDIKYQSSPDIAENTPLKDDPKIKAVNTGKPFGIPCTDGSIWWGIYTFFDTSAVNTQKSSWLPVAGPAVYRMTNSGNAYLNVNKTADGYLLFFSDKNHVHVCKGFPSLSLNWHSFNSRDASATKLAGQTSTENYVHVDPHGLYVSKDFNIKLKAPTGVDPPYNQNRVLDQFISGKAFVANDGGVYRSLDGGATWQLGKGLSVLGPINVGLTALAGKKPGLYMGVGDDDDFYSLDGGATWRDPLSGCGDCDMWYTDIAMPHKVLAFTPRGAGIDVYSDPNGLPDAGSTLQRKQINILKGNTNLVSHYAVKGYRPLILTLQNETVPDDFDFVMIRFNPQKKRVLLRTQRLTNLNNDEDWFDPAFATEVGPLLPFAFYTEPNKSDLFNAIVQTAGGHKDPTYFVTLNEKKDTLWKWKSGRRVWSPIYPNNDSTALKLLRFYVNPYNPNMIYVIDMNGIKRSDDGGTTWMLDTLLDGLVTEGHQFSYNGNVTLIHDMTFSREDPSLRFVIANSGVYMATQHNDWRRLLNATALPSNPFAASFDPISDPCDRSLYVATNGRGLLKIGNIPEVVKKVNISTITGLKIQKNTTGWQTKNGQFNVEHVAGITPGGDLITFIWSPQHDWTSVNVSQKTRIKLYPDSRLTSWQTKNGPFNVEHLAGFDVQGNLISFWWSPQHDWQAVNVSRKAKIQCHPASGITSWQSKNGVFNVEHLAGETKAGDLITFIWSPQHDWQGINVSQKSGIKLTSYSALTSWQSKNGAFNVEHLAGINTVGDLITFWWSPQHDWQGLSVSQRSNQKVNSYSGIACWQSPNGPFNVEHLAAVSNSGEVFTFWWSPQHDWQKINVSQISGEKIEPTSTLAWQTSSCVRIDHLAGVNGAGQLIGYWWTPASDWKAGNLGLAAAQTITQIGTIWQTTNGVYNIEHLAGVDSAHNLLVIYSRNTAFD